MFKYILFLIFDFFAVIGIDGSECADTLTDGPYIFRNHQHFDAVWMEYGSLKHKKLSSKNFTEFKNNFNLKFSYRDLVSVFYAKPDYLQVFRNADSIVAISDIHGAYSEYIALLKSQGVIDNSLAWNFGTGHLVVLGDIFDRGGQVTEIFWHLFGLEKQARIAGGRVHVILGNHELMTFSGDLRYANPKYLNFAETAGFRYQDLYSDTTVLGRWLRFKPVFVTIDSFLFVHAGISRELMERGISIAEINRLFVQMLVEKAVESENDILNLILLTEDNGPLWYRGFFEDRTFTEETADSILKYYGVKSIIVGHTTLEGISSFFRNKIIGIDAGLGDDRSGAVLIIKGDELYRGTSDGKRRKL